MRLTRLVTMLVLLPALALAPALVHADQRGRSPGERRAVRRPAPPPDVRIRPRIVRPQIVTVVPHYSPRRAPGRYYWYPGYGYRGPVRPYPKPGYYVPVPGRAYGGVRIDLPQRDAQVFVGGYYVGVVDSYDGVFQQLNLEAGPHRIEIHAPGYEPIAFDVRVEPGRTITYRASMRPLYR